jgi:hypothetical protein
MTGYSIGAGLSTAEVQTFGRVMVEFRESLFPAEIAEWQTLTGAERQERHREFAEALLWRARKRKAIRRLPDSARPGTPP